jgi:hypothetical protein
MTNDPTPERLLVICRLTVTSDLPPTPDKSPRRNNCR